jgi:hypothetical protein
MPAVDLDTIREWLASHMPSLSKDTEGLSDKDCHARLCLAVEMDYEYGELVNLSVLWRKLKRSHFGG